MSVQQTNLRKIILCLVFLLAIVLVNVFALRFGQIINPTTVAFAFLIIIVTSAIFGGLAIAIVISIVATLFFNYFFLPPIGRFIIYDSHNWVALFAFLFISVVIGQLTASANENRHKAEDLESTLKHLKEFGSWLLLTPRETITLSAIAESAVRIFSLDYCSIHVYAEGKWDHISGTSVGNLSREIVGNLKNSMDHPTDLIELAEEQSLGVRYSRIRTSDPYIAMLVVKTKNLPPQALDAMSSMIGIVLNEVFREAHFNFPMNCIR